MRNLRMNILLLGVLALNLFWDSVRADPLIAYVTDLEGRDALDSFLKKQRVVRLDSHGQLQFIKDGDHFVFGGDAVDRGPYSRWLVRTLVDFKTRHPDRVILIQGNRDINKMRLLRELSSSSLLDIPLEMRQWAKWRGYSDWTARMAPTRLRWILANTMGARDAFEFRRAELRREKQVDSDQAVVKSYLEELGPNGIYRKFLLSSQLAAVIDKVLITHGALTPENFGAIPGRKTRIMDVRKWTTALNEWGQSQVQNWIAGITVSGEKYPGETLIRYQGPLPETKENASSIVYARPLDSTGNPTLPPLKIIKRLWRQEIIAHLFGHTTQGSIPSPLVAPGFAMLAADTSYRGKDDFDTAAAVFDIATGKLHVTATTRAGESFEYTLDDAGPIGMRTTDGRLVRGLTRKGDALLYRYEDRHRYLESEAPIEPRELSYALHPTDCAKAAAALASRKGQ